ncbi:unnamed protein product [Rotaria sp. Silwood1]|nr:unnamed protein product [Rotaria sp. Silwood1]CAF4901793.1 unnamed protein product [Rotaria sp. Silwood1]
MYESMAELKSSHAIDNVVNKVNTILKRKEKKANKNVIVKACKNAVSLLWSKKKEISPTVLTIYLPSNGLESIQDIVVPNASSDEEVSESRVVDDSIHNDSYSQLLSSSSSPSFFTSPSSSIFSFSSSISFSMCNNILTVEVSFDYLSDYFKYSLSMNIKPMNLEKILRDICSYVFVELRFSINVRALKNELSRQIGHILQSARERTGGKSIINSLRMSSFFTLVFKCIKPLKPVPPIKDYQQYRSDDSMSPILLLRASNEKNYLLQFYPHSNSVDVTFNEIWIEEALSSFNLVGVMHVDDLSYLIRECALTHNINLDVENLSETLKTEILSCRSTFSSAPHLLTVVLNLEKKDCMRASDDQNAVDDHQSFSTAEIDTIIGRTYTTRGIKRSYEEDSIAIEPNRNKYREIKLSKDKRDLLHLKDTYHITDSAFNAIFQFIKSKKKLCSLAEIERLRKETNSKFPILFTKTSAYVRFEYAIRTAIFVARKHEPKLEQFDTLNVRFNMDGTLIGNKHIVAISINCIEGGYPCQSSKNLVPLGLFEVQKENTELLRKSLPAEFIADIKSVKQISLGTKIVDIRIRLGGDLMNAVYVFGLAGFSSNYPCIFCTQHKDDLHVTEDTAYDKTVTEGKGRNKRIAIVHVGPTSYRDVTKRARSLAEQASCLATKANDLGYKCEPLFGDLFDYQDYCVDTLHLKLRVFDVILKDILSHASRTGKYGADHLNIIEQKIEILNKHCEKTIGKRFFFQVDSDNTNKTIASHGKLSGLLQDHFFIDSFPYDDILDDGIAKSARIVVNKFKEILHEIKHTSIKRKGVLKRLSLEFVKEFRQSGLRTTVTPYIHIIGNHLYEFDEFNNLGDYNMQGVEKNNNLLSRLYFSSTNPAKNPLLTMLQTSYRMLEMNFQDEKERNLMREFARTGVYDFVEEDTTEFESESDSADYSPARHNKVDYLENEDASDQEFSSDTRETEEEYDEETELDKSMVWESEKRFNATLLPRSENRFKSFRRS